MLIRGMNPGDFRDLCWMLVQEDEGEGCMQLNPSNTFVFDDNGTVGFFMMIMEKVPPLEQVIPSLRYFVIKKNKRSLNTSREAIKLYREFVKKRGFGVSLIVAKKKKLKKFIEYYFKKKPYAEKQGWFFYLVEV